MCIPQRGGHISKDSSLHGWASHACDAAAHRHLQPALQPAGLLHARGLAALSVPAIRAPARASCSAAARLRRPFWQPTTTGVSLSGIAACTCRGSGDRAWRASTAA